MQNPGDGKTALGLDANVGALLCYIPICAINLIYSIIVIVTDKTNKLPRFHAFQSILLMVAATVVIVALQIVGGVAAAAESTILALLVLLLTLLVCLGLLIAVIYSAIKAYQGQIFKLPVIGDMADKWSN
jgi:uncharacterized membrane protein